MPENNIKEINPDKIIVETIILKNDENFEIDKNNTRRKIYFPVNHSEAALIYSNEDYSHDDIAEAFIKLDPYLLSQYEEFIKKIGKANSYYKDFLIFRFGAVTIEDETYDKPMIIFNMDKTPRIMDKILKPYIREGEKYSVKYGTTLDGTFEGFHL